MQQMAGCLFFVTVGLLARGANSFSLCSGMATVTTFCCECNSGSKKTSWDALKGLSGDEYDKENCKWGDYSDAEYVKAVNAGCKKTCEDKKYTYTDGAYSKLMCAGDLIPGLDVLREQCKAVDDVIVPKRDAIVDKMVDQVIKVDFIKKLGPCIKPKSDECKDKLYKVLAGVMWTSLESLVPPASALPALAKKLLTDKLELIMKPMGYALHEAAISKLNEIPNMDEAQKMVDQIVTMKDTIKSTIKGKMDDILVCNLADKITEASEARGSAVHGPAALLAALLGVHFEL